MRPGSDAATAAALAATAARGERARRPLDTDARPLRARAAAGADRPERAFDTPTLFAAIDAGAGALADARSGSRSRRSPPRRRASPATSPRPLHGRAPRLPDLRLRDGAALALRASSSASRWRSSACWRSSRSSGRRSSARPEAARWPRPRPRAFLFSAYLLVVQLAVIHALCTWCVTSDALTTLLFRSPGCASGHRNLAQHPRLDPVEDLEQPLAGRGDAVVAEADDRVRRVVGGADEVGDRLARAPRCRRGS